MYKSILIYILSSPACVIHWYQSFNAIPAYCLILSYFFMLHIQTSILKVYFTLDSRSPAMLNKEEVYLKYTLHFKYKNEVH